MPERVVTVTKVSCATVPYINLSEHQLDMLFRGKELHTLVLDIDKQSRIIDECKKIE